MNNSVKARQKKAEKRLKIFYKVCKGVLLFYKTRKLVPYVVDVKRDILKQGFSISYYNLNFQPNEIGYKIVRKGWGSRPQFVKL